MFSDWVYFIRTNALPVCEEELVEEEAIENANDELTGERDEDDVDDEFRLSIDEVMMKSEGK